MDFSKIGTAAAESEDQSVAKATERKIPDEGVALLRFVEYYELGRFQPKNPKHKVSLKCILKFELLHKKHMQDFDGKLEPMILTVRVNKTASARGRFFPLFSKMNEGHDKHHMIQLLGNGYLGKLTHNKGEGDKVYVNLDDADGAWQIGPPQQVDALTEQVTEVPIPEQHGKCHAFLWENESISDEDMLAMWNDIYIEGTKPEFKDGKETGKEISKNWIQELIQENIEWEGSRIQALTEEAVDVGDLTAPEDESVEPETPVEPTPEY